MKHVLLLGSTGSIGSSTLRVLTELTETHRLVGLAAGRNIDALEQQIDAWSPGVVGVADEAAGRTLEQRLRAKGDSTEVVVGPEAAAVLAREVDAHVVVAGITGAAGLDASLATVDRGLDLALANKESMVVAGPVLAERARATSARILPVDSEHSAIFQCLQGQPREALRRVILTASGGPFRKTSAADLEHVTKAQALAHPTWDMGAKITIDSATLTNKALEVVEARWLFDVSAEEISVVVHPQSIVHSMVEYRDGSILAQLGIPDMAVPIRYALSYPERSTTEEQYFDLERFSTLTFEAPDTERFPGLALGFRAAREGGTSGAALNAANEVAVERFLREEIRFVEIPRLVTDVMDRVPFLPHPTLEQLLETDRLAREEASRCRS